VQTVRSTVCTHQQEVHSTPVRVRLLSIRERDASPGAGKCGKSIGASHRAF
jgi:hypothetical protein